MRDIEQRKVSFREEIYIAKEMFNSAHEMKLAADMEFLIKLQGRIQLGERALKIIDEQDTEILSLKEEVEQLKEELEERKAYIVANPCAQCGGVINAMKAGAAWKEIERFKEKLEIAKNGLADLANTICIETRNPYAHHIVRMTKHAENILNQLK